MSVIQENKPKEGFLENTKTNVNNNNIEKEEEQEELDILTPVVENNDDKNVSSSNMERFKSDINDIYKDYRNNNIYEDYRKMKIGSLLDQKYDKESEIKIDNLEENFKKKLENDKEYQNAKKSARKSVAAMGVIAAIAVSPAGAALFPFAAICIGVLFASSVYHTSKANKILQKHKDKIKKMEENIKLDKEINKMSDSRLKQYYMYKKAIEEEEKDIKKISEDAEKQRKEALNKVKKEALNKIERGALNKVKREAFNKIKSSSLEKNKNMKKNDNLSKDSDNIVNKGIENENNKQNVIANDDIKKDDKAKDNLMDKKDVEVKNEKNEKNGKDDNVEKKENLANEAEKNKEKADNIENKKEEVIAGRLIEHKKAEKNINNKKDLDLKGSIAEINDVNKNNKEQEKKLNKNVKEEKDIVINLNKDIDGINNNKENLKEKMEIKISRDQEENKQQMRSSGVEMIKVDTGEGIGFNKE